MKTQGAENTEQSSRAIANDASASGSSSQSAQMAPPQQNNTGLPDNLKSGIENLSGYSMDSVKVHYNSGKPAQLNAHAFAQGNDIHLAPGQEKHLAHEAWHLVQQKQGRVQPTMQMKGKENVNDDAELENEADEMGKKALQQNNINTEKLKSSRSLTSVIQKMPIEEFYSILEKTTTLLFTNKNLKPKQKDEWRNWLLEEVASHFWISNDVSEIESEIKNDIFKVEQLKLLMDRSIHMADALFSDKKSIDSKFKPSVINPEDLINFSDVAALPANVPRIEDWDKTQSFHTATDKALVPFHERWNSKDTPRGLSEKMDTKKTVSELSAKKRFFSHELPSEYLPFAIAQGGFQSGYNATKSLGKQQAKRDGGKAQHGFVFTRQLPPPQVETTIGDGQVGATADAMAIFKPSMFEDESQMALFKGFDGGFVPHNTPTKEFKSAHVKIKSDEMNRNLDRHFQINQEQAIFGEIAMRHLAIIVLKANTEDRTEIDRIRVNFILRLKATSITSQLPNKEDREIIGKDSKKYDDWKEANKNRSLYDLLKIQTGRNPEELVIVLPKGTKRSDISELAHSIL